MPDNKEIGEYTRRYIEWRKNNPPSTTQKNSQSQRKTESIVIRWDKVWDSIKFWGKEMFFLMMFIVFPILIIFPEVETNYIQPNDNIYHLYKDCVEIRNKKQLRKVKIKEIKQKGYKICKYCERRKDTHDIEELEYWNNYDAQLY